MRKLSKKLVAACMTAAMMLTMVPAAFAAEPTATDNMGGFQQLSENVDMTFERPDGETISTKIYDLDEVQPQVTTMSANAVGTESNPIILDSPEDFMNQDWLGNNYYSLTADVNLSSVFTAKNVGEWEALISGFYGHFNGNGHTISGVPNNEYLFDYVVGGTIENINFNIGSHAAFLVFGSAALKDAQGNLFTDSLTMNNITVEGNVLLPNANQSNYSPFIYAAAPGFQMNNCTNYADITGMTYAAVFYGYTPYLGGAHTFNNCVNHGNVKLNNAALFFGNPTAFGNNSNVLSTISISIQDCKNYGQIRSLVTPANYFVTDVGSGLSTFSQNMENSLRESAGVQSQNEDKMLVIGTPEMTCTDEKCLHQSDGTHDGKLYCGSELEGLAVSVADDGETIMITQPEEADDIILYTVSVSSYASIFQTSTDSQGNTIGVNKGTELKTFSESIPVANLSNYTTDGDTIQANLKYYGIADTELTTSTSTPVLGYQTLTYQGKNYYRLQHDQSITYGGVNDYLIYASSNSFGEDGTFNGGSVGGPSILSVSAIDENGNLVASAYYEG